MKNDAQGQKLLTMKTLVKETVIVQPHGRFNVSQGVITSSSLKEYSEEQIVEGLTDQGVSKAYRIKRKADQGNLIPTNSLILTFNSSIPPEKARIWAGYFEQVRQYIPLPRRCFRCQGYGHTTQNCRSSKAYCGVCFEECTTDHTTTTCNRPFYCLHCQEPHATSSKKCTRYLMEKELLAVKTKEQLTFAEARRRINELFPNRKTTYAAAVRTPPVSCPQPATLQTSQPTTLQTSQPATLQTSHSATMQTSKPATLQTSQPATLQTSHSATMQTSKPATLQTSQPATLQTSHSATMQTSKPATLQTSQSATLQNSKPVTLQTSQSATLLNSQSDISRISQLEACQHSQPTTSQNSPPGKIQ